MSDYATSAAMLVHERYNEGAVFFGDGSLDHVEAADGPDDAKEIFAEKRQDHALVAAAVRKVGKGKMQRIEAWSEDGDGFRWRARLRLDRQLRVIGSDVWREPAKQTEVA